MDFFNILILLIFIANGLHRSWSWIIRSDSITVNRAHNGNNLTLFAKKKSGRVLVTLECTESRKIGMPPSRYYTTKNKINTPERLELMKYNKYLKRHTLHKEIR